MAEQDSEEPGSTELDPTGVATSLALLTPDPRNARRHNERNLAQIEAALREAGAARSNVVDEAGTVLAGNASVQAALHAGLTRVRVVETNGSELVIVRRWEDLTRQHAEWIGAEGAEDAA